MQSLYLMQPYLKKFSSSIKQVRDNKFIVLEETAFYPTSGGQPHDTGLLHTNRGIYTVITVSKIEGEIVHEVDRPGLEQGIVVEAEIDWERRYTLMRYHTASHILSAIMHQETNAEITGNQLGLDKARIDFSLENFDRAILSSCEQKVNTIIKQSLPVHLNILPREEAFKIPSLVKLRKAFDESIQEVRVVEIKGLDIQACGGTHVQNTSEIGGIKILTLENKGKERKRMYFCLS